jgi:hypothetical protein
MKEIKRIITTNYLSELRGELQNTFLLRLVPEICFGVIFLSAVGSTPTLNNGYRQN